MKAADLDRPPADREAPMAAAPAPDDLASLLHALRTPLGAISQAVILLQRGGSLDDDQRWAAAMIERQVGVMTRLLDERGGRRPPPSQASADDEGPAS